MTVIPMWPREVASAQRKPEYWARLENLQTLWREARSEVHGPQMSTYHLLARVGWALARDIDWNQVEVRWGDIRERAELSPEDLAAVMVLDIRIGVLNRTFPDLTFDAIYRASRPIRGLRLIKGDRE